MKYIIEITGNTNKTIVKSLIEGNESLFVNNSTLTENIVSYIICNIKKGTSNLLNTEYRNKIRCEAKITEKISNITGREFAFSETFHLHAKYQ